MRARFVTAGFCAASLAMVASATGQYNQPGYYNKPTTAAGATTTAPSTRGAVPAPLKAEELEQLVAPIALYPDSLLAQVLMASTYPLEVVQADRWAKQNASQKNSPDALNKLTWDPSVKSLIDFPQVLTMMSEKLDWTVKLGDAFIADQKAVMDAAQRLRNKAYAQGNLKTNKEQNVKVEAPSATAPAVVGGSSSQVIVIESSSPSVVYVPTYNPTVVYGSWPYPAYPPSYYYPPGYVAGTALVSFGVGVAVGAAWGHAWGNCNWNGGDVEVDIDKNVNFNGNIDREKYKAERDARQGERDTRQTDRQGSRDTRQTNRQSGQGRASSFQHDPSHRQGVAYRDSATNDRMRGSDATRSTAQARESYRGRTETGRQDINRGAADSFRGNTGSTGGVGNPRAGGMDYRGNVSTGSRDLSGTRSTGFSGGSSYSGSAARADSSRGQASRSSSSYGGGSGSSYSGGSRSSASGGGRSYSGGGGARSSGGGGGTRGGGGRGGGGRR